MKFLVKDRKISGLLIAILGLAFVLSNEVSWGEVISKHIDGNEGSGGGARIESSFRLRGNDLINLIEATPDADRLCPAEVLRSTLMESRVRVVDLLKDQKNSLSLDSNIDAFTASKDIQLLERKWKDYLPLEQAKPAAAVDTEILHEIYRATGGRCNDEYFKISSQVYPMIENASNDQIFYNFRYKKPDEAYIWNGMCENQVNPARLGEEQDLGVCLQLYTDVIIVQKLRGKLAEVSEPSENEPKKLRFTTTHYEVLVPTFSVGVSTAWDLNTLMNFMSETRPFRLRIDLNGPRFYRALGTGPFELIQYRN